MSRPTQMTVREMRAGIVEEALREHSGPRTFEAIAALPRLRGWDPLILSTAVADLIAAGRIPNDDEAPRQAPRSHNLSASGDGRYDES